MHKHIGNKMVLKITICGDFVHFWQTTNVTKRLAKAFAHTLSAPMHRAESDMGGLSGFYASPSIPRFQKLGHHIAAAPHEHQVAGVGLANGCREGLLNRGET